MSYEQYRRDGRVVTKYVGPLERIVEEWKTLKNIGLRGEAPRMVDRPGFEPGASRVQAERSSRLSYRPVLPEEVYCGWGLSVLLPGLGAPSMIGGWV